MGRGSRETIQSSITTPLTLSAVSERKAWRLGADCDGRDSMLTGGGAAVVAVVVEVDEVGKDEVTEMYAQNVGGLGMKNIRGGKKTKNLTQTTNEMHEWIEINS